MGQPGFDIDHVASKARMGPDGAAIAAAKILDLHRNAKRCRPPADAHQVVQSANPDSPGRGVIGVLKSMP